MVISHNCEGNTASACPAGPVSGGAWWNPYLTFIHHTGIKLLGNLRVVLEINIEEVLKMFEESWESDANLQVASAPGPQVG